MLGNNLLTRLRASAALSGLVLAVSGMHSSRADDEALTLLNAAPKNTVSPDFEYVTLPNGDLVPDKFVGHIRRASRSKYQPHQGQREMLRRRMQAACS